MTKDEILSEVEYCFGNLPRPAMLIRGSCGCEECLEHEETMQSFSPNDLPLDKLENPGWDPICFASDEAIAYLMPGLVKLVLNHAGEYVSQFLFHLDPTDRVAAMSEQQCRALVHLLDFLTLHEAEAIDNGLAAGSLKHVKEKLKQRLGRVRR